MPIDLAEVQKALGSGGSGSGDGGGGDANPGQGAATGLITAANFIGSFIPKEGKGVGKGALSGAAAGATVGMAFGPWGAAVGGVVGGLVGLAHGVFKKMPYTTGQYVLGERLVDHVAGAQIGKPNGADRKFIMANPELVAAASVFFTGAFGVRITTSEDLDFLDGVSVKKGGSWPDWCRLDLERAERARIADPKATTFTNVQGSPARIPPQIDAHTTNNGKLTRDVTIPGTDLYYVRPDKGDIPLNAVKRAVYLKTHFFPISSYNKGPWDVTQFVKYPLVAPIPDVNYGKLMDGNLPDGTTITHGIIQGPYSADLLHQNFSTQIDASGAPVTTTATAVKNLKSFLPWIGGGAALITIVVVGVVIFRKK